MARANEGLEPVSDALDAEAARDAAEAEMLRATYTERVARANLAFAVGEAAESSLSISEEPEGPENHSRSQP